MENQTAESFFIVNNEWDTYVLDFDKVKTLDDVILILKNLNITLTTQRDQPDRFKELFDNDLLIKKT